MRRLLINHVRVEDPLLLQVVRDGVLCKQGSLELDLPANPFAFGMRRVQWMVATPAAAELRAEIRALDLIELANLPPGVVV